VAPQLLLAPAVESHTSDIPAAAFPATERQLRGVFENAREGMIVVDHDGTCLDANPAACELLGLDRDKVIGQLLSGLAGAVFAAVWDDFRTDGMAEGELALVDARGGVRHVGYSAAAHAVDERHLWMLHDVTGRRRAEEAVGRLAGGVAHDFNNLLTVISGRTELLLAKMRQGDPTWNAIELIARAAERAARVTQQLLAFSRKQILQPQIVDLNALVEGLTSRLGRLVGEDVELVFTREAHLWRAKVDPAQLEQVIVMLAANARDTMPQGGRLTLRTANVELDAAAAAGHVGVRPGPHVGLVISDTGPGMDAETKARLFEPFFTTTGPGTGTGLGLAAVYGVIMQSGGTIAVDSELGLGTAFRIYFPCVDAALLGAQPLVAAAEGRGVETVLLVEDEEDLRDLARDILETHGYTVLEASSAAAAILLAQEHHGPIHALVTDVVMPQTSGRRLAERIAVLRPETKVLYMSGYIGDAIGQRGVLEPGTPFLQKPFGPDELTAKIRALLDNL
jgi:two-component system cell cycle sensor histidine kinase/response regulator CckA